VVNPAPVTTTAAVPPAATVTTPAADATASTALRANPLPKYTGPGVKLRLPAGFTGPVYVTVDQREVELKPGAEVALSDKASYVVEFDRGGNFGTARYELKEGVYRITVGDKGWDLVADDTPARTTGEPRRNRLPGDPTKGSK
jgi:hypothetical protein